MAGHATATTEVSQQLIKFAADNLIGKYSSRDLLAGLMFAASQMAVDQHGAEGAASLFRKWAEKLEVWDSLGTREPGQPVH